VYGPIVVTEAQQKATVSSCILWIVFDYLPMTDYVAYFPPTYHPVGSEHLAQLVRQEEDSLLGRFTNQTKDVRVPLHI